MTTNLEEGVMKMKTQHAIKEHQQRSRLNVLVVVSYPKIRHAQVS